jgi:multisubunit Na+/H+ antiporter MnhG subunit
MNVEAFLTTVILAIAVAAVSMTIGRAKVSEGFRSWADNKSAWLGKLVNCPYCISHWIALVAVAWYRPRVITSGFIVFDWFVSLFVIVALASLVSGMIKLASFPTVGSQPEKDREREPRRPERPPVDEERPLRNRARAEV